MACRATFEKLDRSMGLVEVSASTERGCGDNDQTCRVGLSPVEHDRNHEDS